MSKSLEDIKILLTRKKEDSVEEIEYLKSFGAEVICFPAIKTSLIDNKDLLKKHLAEGVDIINFSSANAVKYFLENLGNDILSFSSNFKIFAVGEKTAEYCRIQNLMCDKLPEKFSAAGLIELYQNYNVNGKTVLIPCSSKARTELPDGLKELGANVLQIPVYGIDDTPLEEVEKLIEKVNRGIDVFAFTSPSNFKSFLRINSIENPIIFFDKKTIAAIGTTTKSAIEKYNLEIKIIPEKFTVFDLVKAIKNYFD